MTKHAQLLAGALISLTSFVALSQTVVSGVANHGMAGLLETPWAYAQPDGTLSVSLSNALPYVTLATSAQVLPWFWFGARYTQVRDRPYNPTTTNGTHYLDKGFDLVFSPVLETRFLPALSVGLLDIAGTGIFGSEYVVASKSISMFSVSMGLGWGRMGSAGDLNNPLGAVSSSFSEPRERFNEEADQGGNLFSGNWFSGPDTSLFGSVVWHSPARRWQAFVEYDGNIYDNGNLNLQRDNEPAAKRVASSSRFNSGLRWRPSAGTEITAGYIRGNTATLSIRLFGDLDRHKPAPQPVALSPRIKRRSKQDDIDSWSDALWSNGLWISRIESSADGQSALIDAIYNRSGDFAVDSLSIARLTFDRFPMLNTLDTRELRLGMPLLQASWSRDSVTDEQSGVISRAELFKQSRIRQAPACSSEGCLKSTAETREFLKYPALAYTVTPSLRSNIGSSGGFWLSDLQLKPGVRLQLAPNLSVSTIAAIRLAGTLDSAQSSDSSALPHVRSDLERYQSESGTLYLESLEANYFRKLSQRIYGKLSVGILEEMYGGVFTEALWVPIPSRVALGLDLAWVQKRDFDQLFSFRDYSVATGHLSAYWNTGFSGIQLKLSAGRYLAKDIGATLTLSRQFASGLEVGAYATKTDVSAEDFGEGSFDKGFFFYIPLESLNKGRAGDTIQFKYRFLTRDGGQQLEVNRRLAPELGFPFTQ